MHMDATDRNSVGHRRRSTRTSSSSSSISMSTLVVAVTQPALLLLMVSVMAVAGTASNWMYLGLVGSTSPTASSPSTKSSQMSSAKSPTMVNASSSWPLSSSSSASSLSFSSSSLSSSSSSLLLSSSSPSLTSASASALAPSSLSSSSSPLSSSSSSSSSSPPMVIGLMPMNDPSSSSSLSPADRIRHLCNALPGLVSQQIEVCENQPNAIASVSEGARRALQECQFQFRHERWNCTTTTTATTTTTTTTSAANKQADTDVFGHTLQRGSRETAFVYAVTSAGVVHAITQACSSGNLTECSCDMSKEGHATPEGWKWGGCSDNIEHGLEFSRRFVDAPERIKHFKSQNVRNKMNLHNNEAGRKAIEKLMRTQCRCHGVSGSCELKTCWRTLPSFSQVGDFLKRKYANAVRVRGTPSSRQRQRQRLRRDKDKDSSSRSTSKRSGRNRAPSGGAATASALKVVVRVANEDLVHIHKSPNYCIENRTKGILGTRGRPCNKTSDGPDGCDLLCCGRGYNTRVMRHAERCQCKFIWCCYVKCKVCETMMDVHTCK